ncbi:RNA polymerase I-specific transcription initiation factor RRN3 [Fimicolochytrium jonesii]|uniref:RNA polymerase I-specific transcription initiation factor RRN3 n=1 Tax=Fimicolochytrium jonesii TaxID=1396493 RepID=UPI0022FF0167|nr:RNA polymerase I-specific transcription initiation factor RRN3 [Fimicolochytrium jonesii]KAI8823719.1 RNA polymerase I-specific transcription initiation factor RRN3 [Fimicolochytrium jonesii]
MVSAVATDPRTPLAAPTILRRSHSEGPASALKSQQKTVRFDMPSPTPSSPGQPALTERQIVLGGEATDAPLIAKYLLLALKQKSEGNQTLYYEILHLLTRKAPPGPIIQPETLIHWLRAFSHIVSSLTSAFSSMIDAVLSVEWVTQSEETIYIFKHLLENLVSAHAVHVLPVAKLLVKNLRKAPASTTSTVSPSVHFDRVHNMLQGVLALIPTGPSFMLPIVTQNFPHKSESMETHVYYLRNVLRMIDYAPVLRDQVLALIVDRIVQVDVEIQVELDDLDDEVWAQVQEAVLETDHENSDGLWSRKMSDVAMSLSPSSRPSAFTHPNGEYDPLMDELNEQDMFLDSDAGSDNDDDDDGGITPIATNLKEVVEKLDAMLRLVFSYLRDFASQNPGDELRALFDSFLLIFERTILPTHKLRCTQFLWFYAVSLDPTFPELFMGLLVSKLFDVSAPSVIRISASAYLGSFIARANFLNQSSVRTCLKLLHGWTYAYVENNEATGAGGLGMGYLTVPDTERYGVFYSAVQAVVYVFCFRWKQLMESREWDGRLDGLRGYGMLPPEMSGFQRVLMSRFAPFRICAKPIVMEFARITHKLDIMYCFPLIAGTGTPTASLSTPTLLTTSASSNSLHDATTNPSATARRPFLPHSASLPHIPAAQTNLPPTSTAAATTTPQPPPPTQTPTTDRLDAFFPFDPITLPASRRFVDPLYQPWENDEDEDDESSDEEDEDDDDAVMDVAAPLPIFGNETLAVPEDEVEMMSSSLDGVRLE